MGGRTIATSRFGEVEIDDDEIVQLADGLLGFVEMTSMVLLPVDQDGLFFWLQSVEKPDLAFLALVPWALFPDSDLVLNEVDLEALDLHDAADALVFCLLTSHDEPRRFTANLLGPVVVNQRTRQGRQVVLDADLPTQADLPAMDEAAPTDG